MPEDVENTSSEQEEQQTEEIQETEGTEMTDDEAEKLFASIDNDDLSVHDDASSSTDDEDEDDDEEEEDDDSEEESDDEGDEDSEDDDDEEESDEEEDKEEESAGDRLKRMAAEKRREKEAAQSKEELEEKLKTREAEIRNQVVKEMTELNEIEFGDQKIDLKEFSEEYGEEFVNAMKAMAFQFAGSMVKQSMDQGQFVSREELETLKADQAAKDFTNEINRRHPDIDLAKIDNDQNHEFWKWLDKQSDDIQSFVDEPTVAGISAVLDAYKSDMVKADNKKVDSKKKEKKEKHTKLHGSTSRSKRKPSSKRKSGGPGSKGGKMTTEEQQNLFKEAEID